MNTFETFIGVFLAFICKDFYDIFIKKHVSELLKKYKKLVTKQKRGNKK